jgi:type VI protein secretion system component VasF
VDTAVVPVAEIQAEEKTILRRHRRRRVLAWLAILLFVAAVAVLLYLRFVR